MQRILNRLELDGSRLADQLQTMCQQDNCRMLKQGDFIAVHVRHHFLNGSAYRPIIEIDLDKNSTVKKCVLTMNPVGKLIIWSINIILFMVFTAVLYKLLHDSVLNQKLPSVTDLKLAFGLFIFSMVQHISFIFIKWLERGDVAKLTKIVGELGLEFTNKYN